MKIRLVEAEKFHVDGRTETNTHTHTHRDMIKLIVTFHNFLKAPNQIRLMFEIPNTILARTKHFLFLTMF